VIQPDDGRAPILEVIKSATRSIRLTIYAITDLQTVAQTPAAPPDSVVRALMDKAAAGVSVRVIVDQAQAQAPTGSHAAEIQQTIAALRSAGAEVRTSSAAFCYTHQKTFLIDGPSAADSSAPGTAIIMSLNLQPSYFGTSRDYAVITREPGVVQEISRVFEADFTLETPPAGLQFAPVAAPPAAGRHHASPGRASSSGARSTPSRSSRRSSPAPATRWSSPPR
jgi:phosphatidylserine/phosphatidylglycerophosphate/cardiolipin synthase-like enzyme